MVPGRPACLQQPRRDRQVAREIGERAVPADSTGNWSSRKPARRAGTTARSAAPPTQMREGAARLDGRGQVPEDRPEQRLVADRDRADAARPRRRSRSRPACRPGRGRASRAAIRCAGSGDRPGGRRRAARDRGYRSPRRASDARHRRATRPPSSSNGSGTTPDGSSPNASGRRGSPMRLSSGIRGTMPSVAYIAFEIGWTLSVAVARAMPSSSGSRRASRSRPEPGALELGQHEQHREVPQPLADDRRAEGDDPLARRPRRRRDDAPAARWRPRTAPDRSPGGGRTGG